MNICLQARPRGLGVTGSLIGLLALIAVALPQWVLPAASPAAPAERAAVETGHSLRERVVAELKHMTFKKETVKKEETRYKQESWRQPFFIAPISLALLAIGLAFLSLIRREERIYAGVAAALGISAIALQLAILFAGALLAIVLVYAVLNQPDGTFQIAVIVIAAVCVLSIVAVLGMGLVSPLLVALVIGAMLLLIIAQSILGLF